MIQALKYTHEQLGWEANYIPTSDTFRISGGGAFLGNLSAHAIRTMPDWIPVKNVLFISEDGKEVFDGDEYFIVGQDFTIIQTKARHVNAYINGVLRFSAEENAQDYVLMHKTVFSLADVIGLTDSEGVEKAENIAKSRLFPEEPTRLEIVQVEKPVGSISEPTQPKVIFEFLPPTDENIKAIERTQEESTKPTIHQKLEELKATTEVVSSSPLAERILAILGTSEMDMDKLKRSLVANQSPMEKISDGKIYKALDELEGQLRITKTTRQRDGRFVYSLCQVL
jgi:hypothetical protein